MRKLSLLITCLFILLLVNCAHKQPPKCSSTDSKKTNLVEVGYQIVENLIKNMRINLNPNQIVLVSCFVDVNNVQRTSNFGRMLAEHMVSRLSQKGYTVVEMKLRDSLYIKEGAGEFLLSRRLKDISLAHDAQAVIVGTYLLTPNDIYLAARLVQANNAKIISSCDLKLPLSDDLKNIVY